MIPFDRALQELGLSEHIFICPVPSGYPSPKLINLVLRKMHGRSYLFEASAAYDEVLDATHAHLERNGLANRPHVKTHKCLEIGRRQLDADDTQVLEPLPGEVMKVTIARGVLGSYNLTIEGRNGLIKVRRVE